MRHGGRRCVVKVKRKVHTDGLRVNASRLGPRDPKGPGGVIGDPHGVRSEQEGVEDGMKMASVKSGRDSAEAGHASTSRPASGGHLGSVGFSVWASKPRSGSSEIGRPKDAWRHRGGYVGAKQGRRFIAA